MIRVARIADLLAQVAEPWTPHVVGRVNDCAVKLARLRGPFTWHAHADEDELFLVISGELRMAIRSADGERELRVRPGEFVIIPRGVEHLPSADPECAVLLFEPATTLNTGDADDPRRLPELPEL